MVREWRYGIVALVLVLAAFAPAQAQVAVLSVRSIDDLMSDTQYVLTIAGQEDRAKQLQGLFGALTDGKRLQGIDSKKPLGVYLGEFKEANDQPPAVIFIPVTKPEEFLELLKQVGVEPSKPEKGIYSLDTPLGQTIYLKFENGHAYGAMDEELLSKKLPNPTDFLPTVNRKNLLALTARIDKLPADAKKQAIASLEEQLAQDKDKREDETDEQYQMRMLIARAVHDVMVMFVEEGQDLTLSFNVNRDGGSLSLDLRASAVPGSKLAARIKEFGPAGVTAPVHFEVSVGKVLTMFAPNDAEAQAELKKLFGGMDAGKDKVKLTLAGGEAAELKLEVSSQVIRLGATLIPEDGGN
jgi:hypothetical protein